MKRIGSLLLSLLLVFPCAAALAEASVLELPGYEMVEVPTDIIHYDSDIVMTYIQEFANFTQVPRPTHHTEKMTEYLKVWAEARGIACETEEIGNVIMDIPASAGLENAPLVIFQGHIDMVAATDEGVTHDWLNDPLKLIWSENSLTADGTSLGADNGSGVAFLLAYMQFVDEYAHGPLRIVFTVDEEEGLLGAAALDPKYLEGATYMINVDGGYGGAVISCAGGKYFYFSHAPEWTDVPEGYVAFDLKIDGLKGGHSAGVGGGKANALVTMADALVTLNQAGIGFNVTIIQGGDANNAIPAASKASIVLAEGDVEAAVAALDGFAKLFKDSYEAIETGYTFTYGLSEAVPEKVLTAELSVSLVELMSLVPNNIHTLLATASGTEASSNLGMIFFEEEEIRFQCFMRSSSTYQAAQMTLINTALAELTGFTLDIPVSFATWPLKADNKLGDMAAALFLELTGEEYALRAIHAGVECGEFAEKAEDLYIISTGISGGSAGHTTAEAMNFDGVEVGFDFLVKLATKLAEEG